MSTVSDFTEKELIERVHRQLTLPAASWIVVGIGDDAAVIEPERNRLEVLTVDATIEGVHFDRTFTPPDAIGHRALAVNLSDLAAMGAAPRLALLSLALPATLPSADFDAMVSGIAALAAAHRVRVVGGNLTRSPGPLILDVTAVGTVKRRSVLSRGGAGPGDEVYVTGTVGAATAGLQWLKATTGLPAASMESCTKRYLYPDPRVRAGMLVGRTRSASACMDLSDGLSDGIQQIAQASGVGVTIDRAAIPLEGAAREWFESRDEDPVVAAMAGGDDYELLFTVPRRLRRRFFSAARLSGTPVTKIGRCTAEPEIRIDGEVDPLTLPKGFSHFR